MRNFSDYLTAYAVRYNGQGDFYEPWLLEGKEGVWLKKMTGVGIGTFHKMVKPITDFIGYSEDEYKHLTQLVIERYRQHQLQQASI